MRSWILTLTLLSAANCFGQWVPLAAAPVRGEEWTAEYTWTDEVTGFVVDARGRMTLSRSGKSIRLPVEDGFMIDGLRVAASGSDLYLAYEVLQAGEGFGRACRVSNASVQWCETYLSSRLEGAIGKDVLWLGGVGLIARIDLDSGKPVWQQDQLYGRFSDQRDSFEVVCPISEDKESVTFHSAGSTPGNALELRLDRLSGAVSRATVLSSAKVCSR
jgi:hypothetical protein